MRTDRRRLGWITAVLVIVLGGAVLGWRGWERRRLQAVVNLAVPPVPDLTGWPASEASRVRAATQIARELSHPEDALVELAGLYHANARYTEARQVERALAALEPKQPRWLWYLADAAQNLGEMSDVRRDVERTLDLAPGYGPARLKLGDLLLKQGEVDAAYGQYQLRLVLVPEDPYARLGLARVALERQQPAEAQRQLERIVRVTPGFPPAHNLLAQLYAEAGNAAGAAKEAAAGTTAGRFREADDPWLNEVYAWTFDRYRLTNVAVRQFRPKQLALGLALYQRAAAARPRDATILAALEAVRRDYTDLANAGPGGGPGPFMTAGERAELDRMDPSGRMRRGREVFLTVCAFCHMPNGEGLPGIFPPLANSDFLRADRTRAISIPVRGLSGPVTINGVVYNGIMPPQAQLTEAQVAEVMTYVIKTWGGGGPPVTNQEVQQTRPAGP